MKHFVEQMMRVDVRVFHLYYHDLMIVVISMDIHLLIDRNYHEFLVFAFVQDRKMRVDHEDH